MDKPKRFCHINDKGFHEDDNGTFMLYKDHLIILNNQLREQLAIDGVRLSLPDADNYDYLRGFIDGHGGEEPHDVFPDGFNDINEVWDKVYELKGNEA